MIGEEVGSTVPIVWTFNLSLVLHMDTVFFEILIADVLVVLAWDGWDHARFSHRAVMDKPEEVSDANSVNHICDYTANEAKQLDVSDQERSGKVSILIHSSSYLRVE